MVATHALARVCLLLADSCPGLVLLMGGAIGSGGGVLLLRAAMILRAELAEVKHGRLSSHGVTSAPLKKEKANRHQFNNYY